VSQALDRVHADTIPMPVYSTTGFMSFVLFVDEATGMMHHYFQKRKTDLFPSLKAYVVQHETQRGIRLKSLRADNEFNTDVIVSYCQNLGIGLEFSVPKRQSQNGLAERRVRTVMEAFLAVLLHSRFPHPWWPYAISFVIHVLVRVRRGQISSLSTSFALWTGEASVDYSDFHVFGCLCYSHVDKPDRASRLDVKSKQGIFFGYSPCHKGYLVYLLDTREVVVRRDVVFDETIVFGDLALPWPTIIRTPSAHGGVSNDHLFDADIFFRSSGSNTSITGSSTESFVQPSSPSSPNSVLSLQPVLPSAHESVVPDRLTCHELDPKMDYGPKWIHQHNSLCEICNQGGYLVICEFCNVVQHSLCFVPPQRLPPFGDWACSDCRLAATVHVASLAFANLVVLEGGFFDSSAVVSATGVNTSVSEAAAAESSSSSLYLSELAIVLDSCAADVEEPSTFLKAVRGAESAQWLVAIRDELRALSDMGTFRLEPVPAGRALLTAKWVFRVKRLSTGEIERFKARLVARGFQQRFGVDYNETFAPVATYATLRLVLPLAAYFDSELDQIDFSNAFVQAMCKEEVWLAIPPGYAESLLPEDRKHFDELVGQYGKRLGLRLHKCLYGLKQAPRAWHELLREFLLGPECRFSMSSFDPCLFFRREADGSISVLVLYVDDTLMVIRDPTILNELKSVIKRRFKIRDLGPSEWVLKMRVKRDRSSGVISLDQSAYSADLLRQYQMIDCRPVATPFVDDIDHSGSGDAAGSQPLPEGNSYRAAVGSLLHLVIGTRPDIAYAVSQASRHCQAPTEFHWTKVKRIFRYLAGTISLGLRFTRASLLSVTSGPVFSPWDPTLIRVRAHVDSDWGGDVSTRCSTTGFIIWLGDMPLVWRSKLQPCAALSSTEAEYVAASACAQEVVWLRQLLEEIGYSQPIPTVLFEDNAGCIALSKNPSSSGRTKHIAIRYHFLRFQVQQMTIQLMKVSTSDNTADMLTKALLKVLYAKHVTSTLSVIGD
jgi:hypothetical protein